MNTVDTQDQVKATRRMAAFKAHATRNRNALEKVREEIEELEIDILELRHSEQIHLEAIEEADANARRAEYQRRGHKAAAARANA